MVIPVDVVAVLTLYVSVHTTQRVILAIAVYHSTTTNHGGMERQTMHIHANCAIATAMLPHVTITLHWIRSQTAMIREGVESVRTVRAILVSETSLHEIQYPVIRSTDSANTCMDDVHVHVLRTFQLDNTVRTVHSPTIEPLV